jgi:hypothetical protein
VASRVQRRSPGRAGPTGGKCGARTRARVAAVALSGGEAPGGLEGVQGPGMGD